MKVQALLSAVVPDTGTDPTIIRSIAVTADDVVTAFEAAQQSGRNAVIRVTPPFSGRMRARLHVSDVVPGEDAARDADPDRDGPEPVEFPPKTLLADAPAYPRPDATEDAIRADPAVEYSQERHREYHEGRLKHWRAQARQSIADTVTIETPAGPHEIDVKVLGQ